MLRPVIMSWTPPTELRWRGTFLSRRLFSGEHGFRLEPTGRRTASASHQDETFSGLLVPLYARLRLPGTRVGFDESERSAARSRRDGSRQPQ